MDRPARFGEDGFLSSVIRGSFLGIAWSVLKPLMMFCVMYVVFGKFLRMSDGTSTYPVVLLLGISSWQFVTESTNVGLRSVVDRGDFAS